MPLIGRAAAVLAITLAGCAYRMDSMGYATYRSSPLMPWMDPAGQPPDLVPDRKVSEQDCTQPLTQPAANLKCR